MAQNVGQRHLPDTENVRKCYAVESAMFLAKHTLIVCDNPNIFKPEHEDLTNRIREVAINIYLNAYHANKTKLNIHITAKEYVIPLSNFSFEKHDL